MALSLRNVFRRKVRVALTLLTFVLVGVMFIAVVSTRSSLGNAVEMALQKGFVHDVLVVSSRYYRVDHLVDVTQGAPGVSKVEVWDQVVADLSLSSSHERGRKGGEEEILVYGVPPDSEALRPDIVAGRDLLPGEGRAILVNRQMAAERGIQVGDELALTIGGRESTWTVVGVTWEVTLDLGSFVPYETLAREAGHAGRGNTVLVTSEAHDAPSRERLAADLRDVYQTQRIETATLRSADELRQTLYTTIDGISYLLLAMAFLAAVVGGIGLMGTLSINVVERMREIGVMRASGAVSSDIFGIFVGEGVFLGVLSWVLAVLLSYPWARLFSEAVSLALFNTEPDFRYSVPSVVVWLMLVLVLSALASLWPAWRATRVSVREALAYE
jgi:putative ABC transport system permease protein